MVDELIKSIVREVKTEYPHIEVPGAMRAVIMSARKSGDIYKRTIFLTDRQTGEKREYEFEEECYVYSVRITDNDGNSLDKYPVIPDIKSRTEYPENSIVTVVFTGGELSAAIVG
ncbi:MAG: hypothetical protein K2P63_02635 [Lachnospiraceae bacterium]|nr:hypothetical protein [Lachnospiraceae bacterium]